MLKTLSGWMTVLMSGIGGCGWLSTQAPAPVVLAQLSDAGQHPQAKRFTLTGVPRTDWSGSHQWGFHKPNGTKREAQNAMWVVPLQEEGQDESAPIQVWVKNATAMRADASPEAWLRQLESDFGSAPQTLQVVSHSKDADSGWRKAIQDAEQRHGIRSAPNAPVVLWPPEG